jgi:hypothetical protein
LLLHEEYDPLGLCWGLKLEGRSHFLLSAQSPEVLNTSISKIREDSQQDSPAVGKDRDECFLRRNFWGTKQQKRRK